MNNIKIKATMLSILMLASALSGCSATKTETTTTEKVENTTKAGDTATTGEVQAKEYFPLEKPITVTMAGVRADANSPYSDVEMFKNLEQKTNIKINWIDWPQSAQTEKKNLAFASGDIPDAMYGAWVLEPSEIVKYGEEGFLLPLNDYLNEEKMPNFSRIMKALPTLQKSISVPSGTVYTLPANARIQLAQTNDTLGINKKWLEKIGKPIPTTIDEFFDVLMAFKTAGDVNGNGKSDEIPFTFRYDENNTGMFGFIGFTGMAGSHKMKRMVIKGDTPVFYPMEEEYKEALTYLNKLHVNGLLDQEVFTIDQSSYNAKTQTSTPTALVMSVYQVQAVNNAIPGNDITKEGEYVYLAPLQGPSGVKPQWGTRDNPINSNYCFALSAKTKYAEELIQWADLAYDKDASIQAYFGVYDKFVKNEGNGKFSKIKDADGKEFKNTEKSKYTPLNFSLAYILEEDLEWTDTIESPQSKASADAFYAPYFPEKVFVDSAISTKEEADRASLLTADLFSYVDQMTAKFVTQGGVEEGWDAYVKQLKALGVEEYIKIKTDVHNRSK